MLWLLGNGSTNISAFLHSQNEGYSAEWCDLFSDFFQWEHGSHYCTFKSTVFCGEENFWRETLSLKKLVLTWSWIPVTEVLQPSAWFVCAFLRHQLRKQSYPCAVLVSASKDFHKTYCVLVGARLLRNKCLLHSTIIDILELLENSEKEEKNIVLFLFCIWHSIKITHDSSGKSPRDQ